MNIVDSEDIVTDSCDEKYVSNDSSNGWTIGVKKADGTKCNRCWFYDDKVGNHDLTYDGVCQRCNAAIDEWEKETGEKFELEKKEETTAV